MLVTVWPEPKSFNMIDSISQFPHKGRSHKGKNAIRFDFHIPPSTSYPQIHTSYYTAIELRGYNNVYKVLGKYATIHAKGHSFK